ncbi:MAG: hypothetical protein V4708_09895 [Bacteroidota bacterium]
MHAFNMLLTSDGSLDRFPNNYGGDFRIELYDEMDFSGNWEVALSEMTYYGQDFVNVPKAAGHIMVKHRFEQSLVNETVLTWNDSPDAYITLLDATPSNKTLCKYKFEERNYTWEKLKSRFPRLVPMYSDGSGEATWYKDNVKISITDEAIIFKGSAEFVSTAKRRLVFRFSKKLSDLLSLPTHYLLDSHEYQNKDLIVPYKKPQPLDDDSPHLFTWDTPGGLNIYSDEHQILIVPHMFWSWKQLQVAIKNLNMQKDLYSIEMHSKPYYIQIITRLPVHKISFSKDMVEAMGLASSEFELERGIALRIPAKPLLESGKITMHYEAQKYLWKDIYTDLGEFVSNLDESLDYLANNIVRYLERRRVDLMTRPEIKLNEDQKVEFTACDGFEVIFTPVMLEILHLPDTLTSQTGTSKLALSLPICEYFHVNLDLVEPHFVNNQHSQMIRVINNNVGKNQKNMVTFHKLHYYAVSSEAVQNIRIYVSDANGEILPFTSTTTFLLHFRPCRE